MSRLTYREKDWVGVNDYNDGHISPTSVAIHKLAELEDLMEEYEIEDLRITLEYLYDSIQQNKRNYKALHDYKNKLAEENTELKKKLKVSEKALELAVECMRYELGQSQIKELYKNAIENNKVMSLKPDYEMCDFFKQQAEKELKD